MASEIAWKIAERHCETTVTVAANRLAVNVDVELAPVRECLETLSQRGIDGNKCWCQSRTKPNGWAMEAFEHDETCLPVQDLWKQLEVKG